MRENSRSWLNTREEIQQQILQILQPSDTKIRKLYAQQQRGDQQEIQTQITGEGVNTLSKIKGGESPRHQATMESEGNLKWRQHVSAMTKRISNQSSLKHSLQL